MNNLEKDLLLGKLKSAYSPVYEEHVRILKVRTDDNNKLIIDAIVPSNKQNVILFRVEELQDFSKL